ncbi:hypothetical protein DD238_007356 [Peronospora effusa]|uniref:Uncharacterized protein n=1 Tax=Peronospora effusa TaxID=542832 RepID=A0A3M6V850_9STRA|nr:hypothetical protein DD238_007356 [Peronospora effusa]
MTTMVMTRSRKIRPEKTRSLAGLTDRGLEKLSEEGVKKMRLDRVKRVLGIMKHPAYSFVNI